MFAAPGQCPASEIPPLAEQALVEIQVPLSPALFSQVVEEVGLGVAGFDEVAVGLPSLTSGPKSIQNSGRVFSGKVCYCQPGTTLLCYT